MVYKCRECGYSQSDELEACPSCGAGWKAIDVSHGAGCPKQLLEEALDSPNGALVRRCFRISESPPRITITMSDITEEELRTLELIEASRQAQHSAEDSGAKSFQELLLRKLSRR